MAFGTPGGDVQSQAMLQVFLNIVEFGMNPQEAVEAPRFATYNFPNSFSPHTYYPGLLKAEKRINDDIFRELNEKRHKIEKWADWAWKSGGVCAIQVDSLTGLLLGAADPRRESLAMGW